MLTNRRPLSESFLQHLCKENIPVSIFLINGIKLQGQLADFDDQVVILKDSIQLIFKHAISTIVPGKNGVCNDGI